MKNKKPICTEICWKEDGSNLCGNHGTCYVDIKTYKGKCSCSNSNGFVYHGVYCERKAEELKLDSVYIIAIASGSGGAVFIIAVVAVACLIHMKRKMKTLFLTNTDVNSAEMDDFGWERSSDLNANLYRARVKSVANDNKTRLQEQDVTYFQGREHRLYKDDKGDEAYIYQPSSHKSSAETEYNTGPSVYDYIDTDSKFQIQRPNIRIGHLNKY
ncbi:uncharacterized protein LOC132760229 [Ruditapes philippinarum]|uniref:uncharacterized protein LOC132760229 n=1 Tax=Ruditapes philippinarum TaxID=129788 RepID=UPI00295B2B60|nr:uncharacterized protein LOC132760229 [Ruditapes philippinarum]